MRHYRMTWGLAVWAAQEAQAMQEAQERSAGPWEERLCRQLSCYL